MKRVRKSLPLGAALLLAACADPEVVVEVVAAGAEGAAPEPVARLPVRLLPYDRETILDSLRAAAPPEPVIPPELRAQARADSLAETLGILEARHREVKQTGGPLPARDRRRLDSLRLAREAWADAAFASFPERARARLAALRRPALADTTGPDGLARFRAPRGRWWVHARWRGREWNVPVVVGRRGVRVRLE